MKKVALLLAAVAAICVSVQAQPLKSDVIEVGDYTNASEFYNGSYFDMAPTNFYLAHTGVQLLYTPDLLADMNGKEGVVIKTLSFKFNNQSFEDIFRHKRIYIQETDAVEFAVNEDGVKQFFTLPSLDVSLGGTYDISLLDYYGEDVEVSLQLSTPFAYTPGKSLLVTITFDAEDDENCTMGSDYAPFYTSGITGRAMTYTNNTTSFMDFMQGSDFPNATSSLGCGTNVALPVTLIEYAYTESGETSVRGDVNCDKAINIADLTALIDYLLSADGEGLDLDAADCNLDETVNIADVTMLGDYLLSGAW